MEAQPMSKSSTTTTKNVSLSRRLTIPTHRKPTHPGAILLREFLQPLGITQAAFARHIDITTARLSEIIHGKRPVTINSALRFERALGFSAESWLRMQLTVDMYDALHGGAAKAVERIEPITRAS
jgi:addiction module HigA family antidote